MKTLEMKEATGELASYERQVRRGPVVVTRRGKPIMALVSIENVDLETMSLSTDARFMVLIQRSRALYKAGTGTSLAEIKRKYAIKRPKRTRPRRRTR
jgi:prevent-host-death family protein